MELEQDGKHVETEYESDAEESGRGVRIRTSGPRFWRPML